MELADALEDVVRTASRLDLEQDLRAAAIGEEVRAILRNPVVRVRRVAALQLGGKRTPDFAVETPAGPAGARREGKSADGFRAQPALPRLDLREVGNGVALRQLDEPRSGAMRDDGRDLLLHDYV